MKRFTDHKEAWGEFVDVKISIAQLLRREVNRKKVGGVWISGICDPYQPLERKYELTRSCLETLLKRGWPVTIQTKSPLLLRDLELMQNFRNVEVILTITTADEKIRQIFEPKAPFIKERIETLEKLRSASIKTSVMMAPLLPKAEDLVAEITGKVECVLIDKMNYHYADLMYRKHGLEYAMDKRFFEQKKIEIASALKKEGTPYQILF